ncbi:MAG: shikimate kinase [Acidimicrobiia bacterium]
MGHLWLVGMMGSGKSAVGAIVASQLGRRLVDIDVEVAARLGCSIAELWGQQGEEAFRDMEAARMAVVAGESPAVMATGGGAVLRAANVALMRESGRVLWLRACPATLAARIGDEDGRPLLAGADSHEALQNILAQREELYRRAADHCLATDELTVTEAAEEAVAWWNASR